MVGGADRVARRESDHAVCGPHVRRLTRAQPVARRFLERPWREIVPTIPGRLQAPASVQPPPVVTRMDAIALLEASGVRMARALDAVTPERGARHGIISPIVGGAINLYQVGEWATAHVIRHNKQAKLVLGR